METSNKILTQAFQVLYTLDENVFIGAPTNNGKTVCAEFALLRQVMEQVWITKGLLFLTSPQLYDSTSADGVVCKTNG